MKMNISNCINHKDKNKIKNELENLGNEIEINFFIRKILFAQRKLLKKILKKIILKKIIM